jgi:hypothetical protein
VLCNLPLSVGTHPAAVVAIVVVAAVSGVVGGVSDTTQHTGVVQPPFVGMNAPLTLLSYIRRHQIHIRGHKVLKFALRNSFQHEFCFAQLGVAPGRWRGWGTVGELEREARVSSIT